ncbi:MAG: peptide deformylase [Bacteroidales bacterium]|nr:peptide deformylase [Bacteroidales bacterium]MDD4669832.1 peptide deformylase [Bacteroidales bacterium]
MERKVSFLKILPLTFVLALIAITVSQSCRRQCVSFSEVEIERIGSDSTAGIMPLFTTLDTAELSFLRLQAAPLTMTDLQSDEYNILRNRMLCTVLDTANTGVGIAAPQVGISKQLVAVQRFDKSGEPFEFYPNASISYYSPDKKYGWEGCLSVPDMRDTVLRSTMIVVNYNDELTFEPKCDTVSGFTAVIFQHETDHLKGILYTDYK